MLRVFVSSTYLDLLDHRQAVAEAIRGLALHADGMETWPADARDSSTYSADRVRQADVYVLLLAHRYGWVPEGAQFSVTELEYRAAREANVPVLAFFLDEQVPWPPEHIEWEARNELLRFKKDVENAVTRKHFRTPQELALQVTQALAQQAARPAERTHHRFAGLARPLSTPSRLMSEPDVLVPIGTTEDDVPLVLEVSRSQDLSEPFRQLRAAVSSSSMPPPDELLETFRASLVDHATRSWAAADMHEVLMRDGGQRTLYVLPRTLAGIFRSAMSGFLGPQPHVVDSVLSSAALRNPRPVQISMAGGFKPELQSTGGRNRFLAVDPETGTTLSVGRQRGRFVEWRPFVCESVTAVLPNTTLQLDADDGLEGCPVGEAAEFLMRRLHAHPAGATGRILVFTSVLRTDLQALMGVVADIADALGALHADGVVHGDVKPDNVLLTKDGVRLIDSFDVRPGHQAPGWTPDWSAPEQVRGEPVTPCSDIYPMAVMVVQALGGEIVGEVRKYRTPRSTSMPRELDLFHSPSLYLEPGAAPMAERGVRPWRDLVERSLSFETENRPRSMAEFAAELRTLLADHPLHGTRDLRPTGDFLATRLLDGSEAVTRVVTSKQFVARFDDFV
ncbi:DUF4062 domain-containing protein [Lentzea guizhouensis]|uniref:DUF4062 domain-containing protein n=1 Tax=Lentzea guizhouensis TaxID=1586287 RepID=UPI001472A85F|nr:DUF4062 domain-containing protein [Lentzea guizhouensis]